MRLELTRSCDHYPLKVACIPISPPALRRNWLARRNSPCEFGLPPLLLLTRAHNAPQKSKIFRGPRLKPSLVFYNFFERSLLYSVPKTGLEPARLSTLAPETSASTNSAIWASRQRLMYRLPILFRIQRAF